MHFVTCTVCHKSAVGLFQTLKKMILNSMSYLHCTPDLQCLPPASLCGQPSWVGPCCASSCPSCSSAFWCRTKAMVDTECSGQLHCQLGSGPRKSEPIWKKKEGLLTSNLQRQVHSWLMQKDAKGPLHRKGAGDSTQPSSCVLHLDQHRVKYL